MSLDKVKSVEHRFTDAQYDAIMCVLPLISYQPIVTPQMRQAQADALAKVQYSSFRFKIHELKAIISAVELSVQLLSGKWPQMMEVLKQDTEWYQEMIRSYFVLNGLHQEFRKLEEEFR